MAPNPANLLNAPAKFTGLSRLKSVHLSKPLRKGTHKLFLENYLNSIRLKFGVLLLVVIIICLGLMMRNMRATELRHQRYKRTVHTLYCVMLISVVPTVIIILLLLMGYPLQVVPQPNVAMSPILSPDWLGGCDEDPCGLGWADSDYAPLVMYLPSDAISAQTWSSSWLHTSFMLALASVTILSMLSPSWASDALRQMPSSSSVINEFYLAGDAVRSLFDR